MRINKKAYAVLAGLLVTVGAVVALNVTGTTSQAVSSYRNCANDTIIRCGAITEAELLRHYDANVGDVKNIYSHYGISRSDIAGESSQVKHGTVYQDGRVVVEGKTVATNAYSLSRVAYTSPTGEKPRTVQINGTTLYEGPNMSIFVRPVDVYVFMRDGQFYRGVISSCGNPLMAKPVTPPAPKPQPVYSCDNLKATKINRTRFSFTTEATAKNGAEIVNYTYDFGDGVKRTAGKTVEHTYVKPGTYTVKVVVNVKVNGVVKAVPGANCQTTVKVEAVPVKPLYACNSLTAQIVAAKENTYAYTLSYTAENGAALTKVTYNFGDNTTRTYAAANATNVEHTYAKPGSYRTTATLHFNVNGKEEVVKDADCEVAINIPPVVTPPAPKPPVTPEVPTELPQTGVAEFLSGGLGLGSLTAAGYYWINSRKNLLAALLNR